MTAEALQGKCNQHCVFLLLREGWGFSPVNKCELLRQWGGSNWHRIKLVFSEKHFIYSFLNAISNSMEFGIYISNANAPAAAPSTCTFTYKDM